MREKSSSNRRVVPIYDREALKPKNERQRQYINMIKNHDIVLASGASGTGKTYVASILATDMLEDSRSPIEKIVIVRPNEGPGKSIGFLKGTLHDKMIPWAAPILDAIESRIGGGKFAKERVKNMIEYGTIELLPLEYARGKTLNNSFIILDEVQNCDWESLKNLTLRIGLDSKLVICGDIKQQDLKGESGLKKLLHLSENFHVPWQHIEFEMEDCTRSDVCKYLLHLYDEAGI
jgi:phosphate starvation-inducible PhoH-like protein